MAFIANLSGLKERGILEVDTVSNQSGPSLDIPLGDIYWVDVYRLERKIRGWLQDTERTLLGDAFYIAFTKYPISLAPSHDLFIAPRSSLARLGLHAERLEQSRLSQFINPSDLPQYNGRIPLVVRALRTSLHLLEGFPELQILVAEKGTAPLDRDQLLHACKEQQIGVLRNGLQVEPRGVEFPLLFHNLFKEYTAPSGYVLRPDENTERLFKDLDLSKLAGFHLSGYEISQQGLSEAGFYLGSTLEVITIDNRHIGMLTQSYPNKWYRRASRIKKANGKEGYPIEYFEWEAEPAGYVHLTPWIKPNSNGNQTLEIASEERSHNIVPIRKGTEACTLKIFRLDGESGYMTRYLNQDGPAVSRLYRNSHH